jgi:hypothetical protein
MYLNIARMLFIFFDMHIVAYGISLIFTLLSFTNSIRPLSKSISIQKTFNAISRRIHDNPNGIYIHVPFCRQRCFYCDFPISVIGDRPGTIQKQSRQYTDLIIDEMKITKAKTLLSTTSTTVDTVYFGGLHLSLWNSILTYCMLHTCIDTYYNHCIHLHYIHIHYIHIHIHVPS